MKNEFDNNFNSDNLSDWDNPYNSSSTESPNVSNTTPNQYGNAYANNQMPNQYGNTYGNNSMPNQYSNTYGNNPMPNQYGNAYGNNQMPNQYGNNYGYPPMPNQYNYNAGQLQEQKKKKKTVLIVVLLLLLPVIAIIGFVVLAFGIAFGVLDEVKDSEEYALAYSYLVNSETFDRLGVDESEIRFTGYEKTINGTSHGNNKVELSFDVDGYYLSVVCHQDDYDEWFICDECTQFD